MSAGFSYLLTIIRLGRLRFLLLGLVLYLLGALLAVSSGAPLCLNRLTIGYLILAAGHLSMHYSNDYFDYEADLHTGPNALSGGSGILRINPELRGTALGLAVFLALLSVGLGALFTWLYTYPPAYFGLVIFANLLGWYYAAPPVRLSYRGLGEIATVLGVGVLMPLAGVLSIAGYVSPAFVVFMPVLLLYSLSFIVSVEQPDLEADRAGKKLTFVARRGRTTGFAVMAGANLAATVYLAFLAITSRIPFYYAALAISAIPLAVGLYGLITRPAGRQKVLKIVAMSVGSYLLFIVAIDVCLAVLCLWAL